MSKSNLLFLFFIIFCRFFFFNDTATTEIYTLSLHDALPIFAQADRDTVWAQQRRVADDLRARFPQAAALLDDAREDLLAFTSFPSDHWRQIWSTNPQERLNRELRRRSDVVGIFPNRAAIVRLIGAVLAEQHDEWQVVNRYMRLDYIAKLSGEHSEEVKELAAAG